VAWLVEAEIRPSIIGLIYLDLFKRWVGSVVSRSGRGLFGTAHTRHHLYCRFRLAWPVPPCWTR
jgi:hypothetical protein